MGHRVTVELLALSVLARAPRPVIPHATPQPQNRLESRLWLPRPFPSTRFLRSIRLRAKYSRILRERRRRRCRGSLPMPELLRVHGRSSRSAIAARSCAVFANASWPREMNWRTPLCANPASRAWKPSLRIFSLLSIRRNTGPRTPPALFVHGVSRITVPLQKPNAAIWPTILSVSSPSFLPGTTRWRSRSARSFRPSLQEMPWCARPATSHRNAAR